MSPEIAERAAGIELYESAMAESNCRINRLQNESRLLRERPFVKTHWLLTNFKIGLIGGPARIRTWDRGIMSPLL